MGGDADSVAAILGSILGKYFLFLNKWFIFLIVIKN